MRVISGSRNSRISGCLNISPSREASADLRAASRSGSETAIMVVSGKSSSSFGGASSALRPRKNPITSVKDQIRRRPIELRLDDMTITPPVFKSTNAEAKLHQGYKDIVGAQPQLSLSFDTKR